ncbi:hypothetical protein [Nocardia wallacei]|uniref:hypothetical protein n=1 Tax=Nocardia wallacei TaxID=480035 RepID=UPI002457AC71|nr:hypothetical protein [Nocardia wallacei]
MTTQTNRLSTPLTPTPPVTASSSKAAPTATGRGVDGLAGKPAQVPQRLAERLAAGSLSADHVTGSRAYRDVKGRVRALIPAVRRRGAAVIAAAAIAGAAVLTLGHDTGTRTAASTTTASAPPTPATETVVSGSTPGCASPSTESTEPATGAAAIVLFESAYYQARDARLARQVVADHASVPDAATIQAGIDSFPAGTAYCARIRLLTAGLYAVEVTETRPGGEVVSWSQRVTTTEVDGRALITSITSG